MHQPTTNERRHPLWLNVLGFLLLVAICALLGLAANVGAAWHAGH